MDWTELAKAWAIHAPWHLHPIRRGLNNLTYVVDTPDSQRYVLRVYPNHRNRARVCYELELLTALHRMDLTFKVPAPIPTSAGELFLLTRDQSGESMITLSPLLPGQHPNISDLEQVYAAGRTLAALVKALGEASIAATPDRTPAPSFGDLRGWFDHTDDPLHIIGQLPLDAESQRQLLALWDDMQQAIPQLYSELPQQLIHRDYDASNVLMADHEVVGVLDFEFATPDLKTLDLACALSWWPDGLWDTGGEWEVIQAFGQGYATQMPLSVAEIDALPSLMRLRAIATLLSRLGRYMQGLMARDAILRRIRDTLSRESWLEANQAELLRRAATW